MENGAITVKDMMKMLETLPEDSLVAVRKMKDTTVVVSAVRNKIGFFPEKYIFIVVTDELI